jgi:heat-inducible transcriptional repressor
VHTRRLIRIEKYAMPEIDARKQKILMAVVQSYILTGKPVGSRSLSESYDLGISTATIRNEMAVMEKLGLLRQPHTSAGRVPTDIAYRYYVDMLMGQPLQTPRDAEAVEMLFAARSREIEGILREASMLLSSLTHTTAMVFAPFTHGDTVHNVDLVKLTERRFMAVVVTGKGEVGRRLVELTEPVTADTVQRVSAHLDRTLGGRGLKGIDRADILARARFKRGGFALLEAAIDAVCDYLGTFEEKVYIGGTANIVREMDSAGLDWAQALLEVMERQYLILDLLKDLIREKRLTVRIGDENPISELQRCAFVGTSYPVAPGMLGSLGVLGPTCMDYGRTIGTVEYMARTLGNRLSGDPG